MAEKTSLDFGSRHKHRPKIIVFNEAGERIGESSQRVDANAPEGRPY
jgi:hypothetical protein